MNRLCSNDEIADSINNNSMSVIYFIGSVCGACETTKIEDILKKFHFLDQR